MSKKGIDYSKWDKIDDSDDEKACDDPASIADCDGINTLYSFQESPPSESAPKGVDSKSEKGLSEMTKDMLLKEHPELAAQAGLVQQTKVSQKDKKRKQYLHEGI